MIKALIDKLKEDERKNNNFLHLTANENQMSETARMFLGSKLSERYYAGRGEDGLVDFGAFTQLGIEGISDLLAEAESASKKMLGASIVNLSPLSGIHAMMCAIFCTTNPGDVVMTLDPNQGGHFATTGILDRLGRKNVYAVFNNETLEFDIEKTVRNFRDSQATALYLDPMYYIKPYDVKQLRKALGEEVIIIYDASHTIGLIMGDVFQSPLKEGADVICANTHKTLPGPQKGIIAFKDKELGEKADPIIKGSLSSLHTHHLIALAITILEMEKFGKEFAKQVIANSNAIAEAFSELGYDIRKAHFEKFSDNHQVHIFIEGKGNRLDLNKKLIKNNISTNFASMPGNKWYIRIGTQEITRRGMKEKEMKQIALFINRIFSGENLQEEIITFNKKFPHVLYSFDQEVYGLK